MGMQNCKSYNFMCIFIELRHGNKSSSKSLWEGAEAELGEIIGGQGPKKSPI